MDKKIIQLMFANVCAKDELRPVLSGVHFEEARCYATDGHLLVIYEESNPKLTGKTMSQTGEEIDGRYPNVDRVFPAEENFGTKLNIDIEQLYSACMWHMKQKESADRDGVVINGVSYNVILLKKILNVALCGGARNVKFYNSDPSRATVITSSKLKCLIMPQLHKESEIDSERLDENCPRIYSYENFINEYVFNSWRKEPKKEPLSWID